jgi:DNA polymerase (family 10)
MKNLEIAKIFYEIADILEIQGVEFKPMSYRKAAKNIESLSEDIEEIWKEGKLRVIPGVGENISKKIEEIILTGKLKYFDKLKKKAPMHFEELMKIPGMGPKKIKILYQKLKVASIKDLEKAAKKHKLAKLEGMGIKSEEDILRGIELLRKGKGKILLGYAYPMAKEVVGYLKKSKDVYKINVAGSLRRMKETIRDVDILVISSKPENVMDYFTKMPLVKDVLAKGKTKSTVILENGLQVDVRVVNDREFGSAMQYFTGSKEHSISLRRIAIKKGLKISEYGVFKKKSGKERVIARKTEKSVYGSLGMGYIEPELRENRGEIEAALHKQLPKLIGYGDVLGDLHAHSMYSDGVDKIEDMAKTAYKLGYKYICITDHSQSQKIANGLSEKELLIQGKEIDELNKQFKSFKILKGTEVDIKSDGSLDWPDRILKSMDVVVASIHSGFKSPNEEMTKRILKGLDNKYVNIFAHPTGRLINQREPYNVDLEKVYEKAEQNGVCLEINSFPSRLDLNDGNIKRAKEFNVKFVIDTDAHSVNHLEFMRFGIATARRGWCEKKDVLNSFKLKDLLKILKK